MCVCAAAAAKGSTHHVAVAFGFLKVQISTPVRDLVSQKRLGGIEGAGDATLETLTFLPFRKSGLEEGSVGDKEATGRSRGRDEATTRAGVAEIRANSNSGKTRRDQYET